MIFISKNSNYLIILRASEPAVPAIGKPAVRGLSVRFEDGKANVEDEEMCSLLLSHKMFKTDFVLADGEVDPFEETRGSIEPEHNILEIKGGVIAGNVNPVKKDVLNKEQKKVVKEMAEEMAEKRFKEMMEEQAKQVKTDIVPETDPDVDNKKTEDKDNKKSKK